MARVPAATPTMFVWTDHALAKAQFLGLARIDVEDIVTAAHPTRHRNTGAADWLILSARVAVAYNNPVEDDPLRALIVTVWRPR